MYSSDEDKSFILTELKNKNKELKQLTQEHFLLKKQYDTIMEDNESMEKSVINVKGMCKNISQINVINEKMKKLYCKKQLETETILYDLENSYRYKIMTNISVLLWYYIFCVFYLNEYVFSTGLVVVLFGYNKDIFKANLLKKYKIMTMTKEPLIVKFKDELRELMQSNDHLIDLIDAI